MVKGGTISKKKTLVKSQKSLGSSAKKNAKLNSNEASGTSIDNPGLPRQSTFCTECRVAGHNRTRCGGIGNPPRPKKGKAKKNQDATRCSRCELSGHTPEECLVLEDDGDTYYLE